MSYRQNKYNENTDCKEKSKLFKYKNTFIYIVLIFPFVVIWIAD